LSEVKMTIEERNSTKRSLNDSPTMSRACRFYQGMAKNFKDQQRRDLSIRADA
jgi:hypothetical protein